MKPPLKVYSVGLHEHANPNVYASLHTITKVSSYAFKSDSYITGAMLTFAFTNYANGGDVSAWAVLGDADPLYINVDGYPGVILSAVSPSNDSAIETPPLSKTRGTNQVMFNPDQYMFRAANEKVSLYFSGTAGQVDNGNSIICASLILFYVDAGGWKAYREPNP